jgi:hypothetical protein
LTAKWLVGLACGLLSACGTLELQDAGIPSDPDFVAFGAAFQAAAVDERRAIYRAAVSEHQASPTAESAIRLAIAGLGGQDILPAQEILSLLAFAERSTTDEDVIEFLGFFRPLAEQLIERQAAVQTEAEARRALEAQLEALKALEEQLDSPGAGR